MTGEKERMPDAPTSRDVTRADAHFRPGFERWAGRVRGRLAARRVLTGAALGLVVALAAAALAWRTGRGPLRPMCGILGLVGAAGGMLVARRKRWSDVDVALWLDERLGTQETIATAVELDREKSPDADTSDEVRAVVVSTAATALSAVPADVAKRAHPSVLRPLHALVPIGIAGLVLIARSPLPFVPPPTMAPGDQRVQLSQVDGLKKVAELGQAHARDEEQRQRLDEIAKDAEKLRVDLEKGLEKREALDRIAKLRDEIAAERLSLGEGERRAGLEAAISKLQQQETTQDAARALGDHDLEKMDREMERIANAREKQDRQTAKQALADAAAAARSAGAPDVAKALEEEQKAFAEREKRSELLRELEKAMEDSGTASPEQQTESSALDRKQSDESARKLADAMGKALEKLTPEQRQRLAKRLEQQAKKQGKSGDPQKLKDLADDLSSKQGQQSLEDQLKQMADADDESPESSGQQSLDDAEDGADGTEGQINGQGQGQGPGQGEGPGKGPGVPTPGQGQGPGSNDADGDDPGGGGHHHDTGTGSHAGHTGEVDTGTLRSRAHGPVSRAPGMPGSTTGWTPGKADGTANVRGTGALGTSGPGEIDGVDHSDVPEEYREQVRQYFQP
jgi:hypothetical protein